MITAMTYAVICFAFLAMVGNLLVSFRQIGKYPEILTEWQQHRKKVAFRLLCLIAIFAALVVLAVNLPGQLSVPYDFYILKGSQVDEAYDPTTILTSPLEKWRRLSPAGFRSFSIKKEIYWLKAEIPKGPPETLTASNRSDSLNKIDFYLISKNQIIYHDSAGLDSPVSNPPRIFPTFHFLKSPTESQTLLVRVETVGFTFLPITLLNAHQDARRTMLDFLIFGLMLGVYFGTTLYNISLYFSFRDRLYLIFAASQCIAWMFLAFYSTYFMSFLRTDVDRFHLTATRIASFLALATLLTYVWFLKNALNRGQNRLIFSRAIGSYIFSLILAMCLIPYQDQTLLEATVQSFAGLGPAVVMLVAIPYLWRKYVFSYLIALTVGSAGLTLHILTNLEFITPTWVIDHALSVSALIQCSLFSLAISQQLAEDHISSLMPRSLRENPKTNVPINSTDGNPVAKATHPAHLWRVSLMFVDMANFSLIAEKIGSVAIYHQLSAQMEAMRQIIKEYGGAVDRSLGDGLLCFFTEGDMHEAVHYKERAIRAAIAIQKHTLDKFMGKDGKSVPPMPIRIGLHCDQVLIGNLGWADRVDFTMIGKGVIHAQQLEAACSPFKILLSNEFYDGLKDHLDRNLGMNEIHIVRDVSGQWLKAHEYNPFFDQPQLLEEAEKVFVRSLGIYPHEMRHCLGNTNAPSIALDAGLFRITDFSLSGLGVVGDVYIARKARFRAKILDMSGIPAAILTQHHLEEIEVEVRWSRHNVQEFNHGLKYIGLNNAQKKFLFEFLTTFQSQTKRSDQGLAANLR